MTLYALFIQLGTFWSEGNWLLLVLDIVILVASLWVMVEALGAMRKAREYQGDDDAELEQLSTAEVAAPGGPGRTRDDES